MVTADADWLYGTGRASNWNSSISCCRAMTVFRWVLESRATRIHGAYDQAFSPPMINQDYTTTECST